MASTSWAERLSRGGFGKKALERLVATLHVEGRFDHDGAQALAALAEAREDEGHGDEAALLAALVLGGLTSAAPPPATDPALDETRRWTRHRLRVLLRRHANAPLAHLPPEERAAIEEHEAPLAVAALLALGDEPTRIASRIHEAIMPSGDEQLAEGLDAIARAAAEMAAVGQHDAACTACCAGLELDEKARTASAPGQEVMGLLTRRLERTLVSSLAHLEHDAPLRLDTIKWLTKTKSGEVRVGRPGFPADALAARDLEAIVASLGKRASKSATAATALLEVGRTTLAPDAYLALCRELDFAHGIVTSLLDRGDVEAAAEHARAAITADDTSWKLAKLFHARGHTSLAVDMLRGVAEDTVSSELELWLADRLEADGAHEEVLALYRNRFTKRPAIPQYRALRDRVGDARWPTVREELLGELRARRLLRPLVDIAANERDVELLASLAPDLDGDQAEHAKLVLAMWLESSDTPRPAVEKILAELAQRTDKGDVKPKALVVAAPVPKRVRHKKFGEGEVVGWSGERDDRKLEIEFEGIGRKVLLARFVEVVS